MSYKKIRSNFYLKLFLIFVAYSFLTELTGIIIGLITRVRSQYLSNIWILVNVFFYLFFFLSRLKHKLRRNILKGLLLFFLVYSIIEVLFFGDFLNIFMIRNAIVGSLFIMISVLLFFYELLMSDKILNLKESMFYWIGLGVLLFNVGFIPAFVISEFISFGYAYRIITFTLNLFMAGCFITGFIVSEKEFNS
ncbi:MAG: hypothetical protein JKY73_02275 [Lutibacter sp.]|nr:hypothetical protein [Lutibacter sp.]